MPLLWSSLSYIKKVFNAITNIIIPPCCLNCSTSTKDHLSLCDLCNNDCIYTDENCCLYCGLQVPPHPKEYTYYSKKFGCNVIKCDFCYEGKYNFDAIFCPSIYGDVFSNLASRLKFSNETQNAKFFAKKMVQKLLYQNLTSFDIITCVPLSYQRFFNRGYNQSALIAKFIYLDLKKYNPNIVFLPTLIKKIRHTKQQSKLSKSERIQNLLGCFEINEKISQKYHHKNILLIDDISTTLSTLQECSKTIKQHSILKPKSVICSTFSRVDIL